MMPGRRVFFSFHYERDIWRATNVRNAGKVDATTAAGWDDASLWEEAKRSGRSEVECRIDVGLKGTSVTAVLIGSETADRPWVTYEIEQSIERGNGLLGIRIHGLQDQDRHRSKRGAVPEALNAGGYRVYDWSRSSFGRWVEQAALDANKPCLSHDRKHCFMCRWMRWW
jgi:hypothetical protein